MSTVAAIRRMLEAGLTIDQALTAAEAMEASRPRPTDAFQRFWRAYPHKVGKPAAERAFHKVAGEIDAILSGLDRYIRNKPDERPWLNPATFLNQRRWEDEPAPTYAPQSNRNGFSQIAMDWVAFRKATDGQESVTPQNVRVLPFRDPREQGTGSDDAGSLFREAAKRLG
jgi:hypothetical protein